MKRMLTIAVLSAVVSSPTWAGCSAPTAVAGIPDGKTASKDVMLAKKKEVDQYRKDVEAFLSCEGNSLRAENAQADLEKVAAKFNAEIRAFKAANTEA